SIVSRRQSAASSVIGSSHRPSVSIPPPIPEAIQADRQRLTSLSDEAASWHEDHQDPIEMHSQNDAGYPAPSFYVTDGHDGHRRASEISTASSIRPPNVGGHSAKFHQNPYEYSNYGNSDTGTGTETAESSPHHQQRYTPTPDAHATPQAYYTPAERARHRADPPIVPASPDSVFGSPNPPPPPQQHQQHHQQQQQHHQQQHQQQQQQHQQHQLPPVPAATPAAPPALSFSPSPDFDRRPSETPAGQSQHQPPTSAQLQPPPTAAPKTPASAPPDLKRSNSGQPPRVDSGSRIKKWLTNILPDKNAMKLPDDSSKSIYWDNNLKKWIGDGVADETPAQPPPVLDNQSAENLAMAASTQGLKAARRSGGSRYFNPLDSTSGGSVTDMPSPSAVLPPAPPVPSAYHGFIPTMPVENGHTDYGASEDYSSPFSSSDPFSYSDPSQQQAEMA
uniref:Uncharacterized protein n=1 Tax=Plectus sambesii TaxID=2011161 RepID=A0A914V2Q1_9BILA